MIDYRAYLLSENEHIAKRIEFEAEDDERAMEHARQYVDGHDVELWQRARCVGRLSHLKG